MIDNIRLSFLEAHDLLEQLLSNEQTLTKIEYSAQILIESLSANKTIYSCGNGGSMCDAMHFAQELTGRYRKNRKPHSAIAIADASHISCVGNDFGYNYIFSRYLEAHGKKGDCLFAISTSGESQSIANAVETASAIGMKVIVLSGRVNEALQRQSNIYICTPGGNFADRVQELHVKVIHILIEMIERHFHPGNY